MATTARAAARLATGFAAGTLALMVAGCGAFGGGSTPSPTAGTSTPGGTATPFGTASPGDTASPSPSGSPGDTASPGRRTSATPGSTGTPTPGSTETPSVAPLSCTTVTPIRIQKVNQDPRRTIEVVTLVSDGRNLTPGTREQTDFGAATLTAPDATTNTDQATLTKIVDLIKASSRDKVLLERPDPPDAGADAGRRPYNAPGTYVTYNATSPLTADVVVQCSGQEQRWQFTAESDLTTGVVNCAVEPPRSNAVARLVYANNC